MGGGKGRAPRVGAGESGGTGEGDGRYRAGCGSGGASRGAGIEERVEERDEERGRGLDEFKMRGNVCAHISTCCTSRRKPAVPISSGVRPCAPGEVHESDEEERRRKRRGAEAAAGVLGD